MIRARPLSPDLVVECFAQPKVFANEIEAVIEAEWNRARQANPTLYNGQVLTSKHIHLDDQGAVTRISGRFIDYRTLMASRTRPDLFGGNPPVPIGCTGLTLCRDGVVLGCRSTASAFDGGKWELVPAGAIDSGAVRDGHVDLAKYLLRELQEELSISQAALARPPMPFALIENTLQGQHQIELGLLIELSMSGVDVERAFAANQQKEHSEIAIVAPPNMAALDGRFPTLLQESRALVASWLSSLRR